MLLLNHKSISKDEFICLICPLKSSCVAASRACGVPGGQSVGQFTWSAQRLGLYGGAPAGGSCAGGRGYGNPPLFLIFLCESCTSVLLIMLSDCGFCCSVGRSAWERFDWAHGLHHPAGSRSSSACGQRNRKEGKAYY